MAVAGSSVGSLEELFDCPVCFHQYRNPRILYCGHHFCEECINQIAERNSDGNVPCPTCRKLTELSLKVTVTDLPRPVILNELQEKIGSLLSISSHEVVRICDVCKNQSQSATTRCMVCSTNMCKECMTKHQKITAFASHKTISLKKSLFCGTHAEAVVTMYCNDCKVGTCRICAISDHSDHNTKDVIDMVKGTREKLTTFLTIPPTSDDNRAFIVRVKAEIKLAQEKEESAKKTVGELKSKLDEMKAVLTNIEKELDSKPALKLNESKFECDLDDIDSSRKDLSNLAKYLVEEASDLELVIRGQEFPDTSDITNTISSYKIRETVVAGNLEKMVSEVNQWITECKVSYKHKTLVASPTMPSVTTPAESKCTSRRPVGNSPMATQNPSVVPNATRQVSQKPVLDFPLKTAFEKVRKIKEIKMHFKIKGLCTSNLRNHKSIVVRLWDKKEPIKVYDYQGGLLFQFGGTVKGIADEWVRGISIDTRRRLYLAPCFNQIVRFDIGGQPNDVIQLPGNHRDIAHLEEEDLYVVSDFSNNCVWLINPENRQIVGTLDSRGRGDESFNQPYYISVGKRSGKAIIAVCDRGNHVVKVFSPGGQHIQTYGSYGRGDGQFCQPRGVCVDPAGRILVCDTNNGRLTSFWTSKRNHREQWTCLLSMGGQRPRCVASDIEERMLFVTTSNNWIYVFSCVD